MSKSDDSIGGIVLAGCALAGGWWLWSKFEIEERNVVVPIPAPAPSIRPTGVLELTADSDGSIWFLDADSVRGTRQSRQGWVTVDHSQDKTLPQRTSKTLYLVDCATTGTRELSFVAYDANGRVLSTSDSKPEEAATKYFPPDSVGWSVPNEICRRVYD